jgi:hypothetical protein
MTNLKLPRRKFLHLAAGAAALPAVTSSGLALAQCAPAPRAKGPRVWLDMDQKELDDAYTQSVYAPNLETILKRCARNGELVRERIGTPKRFAYGPTAIEGVDVFPARMHPCTSVSMAALGVPCSPATTILRPRCLLMPARISLCQTLTT